MADGLKVDFGSVTQGTAGTYTVSPKYLDNASFDGRSFSEIFGQLIVSQECAGVSPTLNVYVQTSVDDGTTWRDVISFDQATVSNITKFAQVSAKTAGAAATLATSDAALAAATTVQGPFGSRVRLKYVVGGTGLSSSYIFQVIMYLKG